MNEEVVRYHLRKVLEANKGDKYGRGYNDKVATHAKMALDALNE